MPGKPIVVWFRNDLRTFDQPALSAAAATGAPVIGVYVLDDVSQGRWKPGAASRWWLHHSLAALERSLRELGGVLLLRRGKPVPVLTALAAECEAGAVYCSRAYEPWAAAQEAAAKQVLEKDGIAFKRFSGVLLREPEEVRTKTGDAYKVYTPFWRALAALGAPAESLPRPKNLLPPAKKLATDGLADWGLLPTKPDWAGGFRETWQPGEEGALARLERFVDGPLKDYAKKRNFPADDATSRLSPHLHFGEISPRLCWHRATAAGQGRPAWDEGVETFLKELVWREFSYHLLTLFPELPDRPFRPEFAAYPWQSGAKALRAWQRGQTGYPIVDAGMRELWHTGIMHNRVRMVTASFLIKHLLLPWQEGEAWFWDTLVDADLASNAASWQWVAGSGADAAPYFRIFNPVTQGEKFDPDGRYVRRWVPEIATLPDNLIHAPWTATALELRAAGVALGKTYPLPIVDHAEARVRALAGYEAVKAATR